MNDCIEVTLTSIVASVLDRLRAVLSRFNDGDGVVSAHGGRPMHQRP